MSEQKKEVKELSLADKLKGVSLKSKDILSKKQISSEKVEDSFDSSKSAESSLTIEVEKFEYDNKRNLLDYFSLIENNPDRFIINKSSVYVDDDIHEIFLMIKKYEKVNISKLVSVILEEFIMNHREEIEKLMKPKNKFLT